MSLLPTSFAIRSLHFLSQKKKLELLSFRETIKNILTGKDPRLLMILGPCSLHDFDSILAYAKKFKELSKAVEDRFFLVLRSYYEKPRSINGWKGFVFDPELNGNANICQGIEKTRCLLLELSQLSIPLASEFLDLNLVNYFEDLLSWGCIGARTSSSQPHRQFASHLTMPIGFKNTTTGNVKNAIHGVMAAQISHVITTQDDHGHLCFYKTSGNPFCHIILRGSDQEPNYDPISVTAALELCETYQIKNKIIIDCAHGNCQKLPKQQLVVLDNVVEQILSGNCKIGGIMMESHLFEGNQSMNKDLSYGISLTDPCIGWESTEKAILEAYKNFSQSVSIERISTHT